MFKGKMKAVTFSYDDGVTQDKRLIELLNKYSLKATFNINSEFLGTKNELVAPNFRVNHNKNFPSEVKEIYKGHEVAVHTLTHPNLTTLDDTEVVRQVEEDRKNLSRLVGYDVTTMAYPCGGTNNDDRVANIIAKNTGVKFSRTITSTYSFDIQDNLYRYNPTVYHLEWDKMFCLAEEFMALTPETPKIFYIWGHSYEFDIENTWDKFEKFCKLISGKDDIFYGTNREIFFEE